MKLNQQRRPRQPPGHPFLGDAIVLLIVPATHGHRHDTPRRPGGLARSTLLQLVRLVASLAELMDRVRRWS
jgi:hypothetical protein